MEIRLMNKLTHMDRSEKVMLILMAVISLLVITIVMKEILIHHREKQNNSITHVKEDTPHVDGERLGYTLNTQNDMGLSILGKIFRHFERKGKSKTYAAKAIPVAHSEVKEHGQIRSEKY